MKETKQFQLTLAELKAIDEYCDMPIFEIDKGQQTFSVKAAGKFRKLLDGIKKEVDNG